MLQMGSNANHNPMERYQPIMRKEYLSAFSTEERTGHTKELEQLSKENPCSVLLKALGGHSFECTVIAFDYPWEFSLITGILSAMGFNITSGDVFTLDEAEGKYSEASSGRKKIVDRFIGTVDPSLSGSQEKYHQELSRLVLDVISLLENGGEDCINKARELVNSMAVKRMAMSRKDESPLFYPVQIELDNDSSPFTTMRVISQDTPAFLYSLSTALSLHGVIIERVNIRTVEGQVEDRIDILDSRRRKIVDPDDLNRLKISALLTKQFTHSLGNSPDPFAALLRFGRLVSDILVLPEKAKWLDLLTKPDSLNGLARILGASDYLWEDFIRLQYEALLPVIAPEARGKSLCTASESVKELLSTAVERCESLEEKADALNKFKDRELFLVDLDQILHPDQDFEVLSSRLTALAEAIVTCAVDVAKEHLVNRFGVPRSVGGIEAAFAVFGLGKLGGKALGYASDIELLFAYSDNGSTDGRDKIANSEFFDRLVRLTVGMIRTKREGIFKVDLRLRPYGDSGPLSVSLESFCRYFGVGGSAHSYERLALVRLRAIAGDAFLGSRIERIRDEVVYSDKSVDREEINELRERQFLHKAQGNVPNAKFCPGGLVDLEYGIQALQTSFGKDCGRLRTPVTREALEALDDCGIIGTEEKDALTESYFFLRKLINGIRMLRGSAKDLFLPPVASIEAEHLARRIGYTREGGLEPREHLKMDFEIHTAAVRAFIESRFGKEAVPSTKEASIADVILSGNLSGDMIRRILTDAGFGNPARAYMNLVSLAGTGSRKMTFARLALLSTDILRHSPDPDMALNNWERFINAVPSPEFHYGIMLSQPMRLEILLRIFSWSQFLADTLVRNPGFLDWVVLPEIIGVKRDKESLLAELRGTRLSCGDRREWLNELRRLRRREILRIGVRDVGLGVSVVEIMEELSTVAQAFIEAVVEGCWDNLEVDFPGADSRDDSIKVDGLKKGFSIIAFGKLGGSELNYSSDVDLVAFYDDQGLGGLSETDNHEKAGSSRDIYKKLTERIRHDLSVHTEEGYAYRVDLRLRPFGSSGELVPSASALIKYYREAAAPWEIQAAIKARSIAGNIQLGEELLHEIRLIYSSSADKRAILRSIGRMRRGGLQKSGLSRFKGRDVKNDPGGIRDAEFLIQGLQLIHGPSNPKLFEGNTLKALSLLAEFSLINGEQARVLREDYIFLRKIEHCLQIMDDRQIHLIPSASEDVLSLVKRLNGMGIDPDSFFREVDACFLRIRTALQDLILEK